MANQFFVKQVGPLFYVFKKEAAGNHTQMSNLVALTKEEAQILCDAAPLMLKCMVLAAEIRASSVEVVRSVASNFDDIEQAFLKKLIEDPLLNSEEKTLAINTKATLSLQRLWRYN